MTQASVLRWRYPASIRAMAIATSVLAVAVLPSTWNAGYWAWLYPAVAVWILVTALDLLQRKVELGADGISSTSAFGRTTEIRYAEVQRLESAVNPVLRVHGTSGATIDIPAKLENVEELVRVFRSRLDEHGVALETLS